MTTVEKAKAYDEVVARIKKAVDEGLVSENFGRDMLAPESEDERIRKALIDVFAEKVKDGFEWKDGIPNNAVLSWLERQKEPTDGDFARGYDCGYECCLHSHGAEWFEKQKEPHYTKRNALFDKCVEDCDPEVMKSVSNEVDLEKELEKWRHDHFKGKRDGDYNGEYLERESQLDLARYFWNKGLNARKL